MTNYLTCDSCQHKNTINSERIVFCKNCNKKLVNNYIDWKKTKFDSSFETYIAKETLEKNTSNEEIKITPEKKINVFNQSKLFSNTSTELKIFLSSSILQIILYFFLTSNSSNAIQLNDKTSYLNHINWNKHSITQNLSITLPFELKDTKSVLPEYLKNYLSNEKILKAESSKSFSVTIEEFDIHEGLNIDNQTLLSIKDEYMQDSNSEITSSSTIEHYTIKKFNSYSQYGTFTLDSRNYNYENYTLTSGNKIIKIIISYQDGDNLLRKYADIVSQSILDNKTII
jgi:hypothetical protein